jgi:hypothetical protein
MRCEMAYAAGSRAGSPEEASGLFFQVRYQHFFRLHSSMLVCSLFFSLEENSYVNWNEERQDETTVTAQKMLARSENRRMDKSMSTFMSVT